MNILFFTTIPPDYLQDSILIGLRQLSSNNLIDYPQKDCLYKNNSSEDIYGRGFTLYNYLSEINVNRKNIKERIINKEFDLIIFSSIHRQIDLLKEYYPLIKKTKVVFLDGEDHPSLFGYNGRYWRNPKFWFLPKIHKRHLYFKREFTPETLKYRYYKIIPGFLLKHKFLKNGLPISFAFPDSKIIKEFPIKEKLFPEHIVDIEIAKKLGKKDKYVFDNEEDYYSDLKKSKFGITTIRAGWDAMRHYEIAANGAVICFKNLHLKPETCAPHGLNNTNSITYKNYGDLMKQINNLSNDSYKKLQENSYKWILENSTKNRAKQVIKIIDANSK